MTLGGRAAEELVFGEITTGASNDIEKVTAHRQADGDALRHEREARPARVRPRPRPAVPRPRVLDRARLLRRDRARDRRRGAPHHRVRPRARARASSPSTSTTSTKISEILVKRETIEKEEFLALLAGKSEEEVFGVDERSRPSCRRRPSRPSAARARAPRRAPTCRGPAMPPPEPGGASSRRAERRGSGAPSAPHAAPVAAAVEVDASLAAAFRLMGDRQRDARLVLRRRALPRRRRRRSRTRARSRARAPTILDVGGESTRPGAEPVSARGGAAPRAAGARGRSPRRALRGAADLDRHLQGAPSRARRSRPARASSTTSARCAPTPRWPALVADSGARLLPDAHARRAAHDADATRATATSSTR